MWSAGWCHEYPLNSTPRLPPLPSPRPPPCSTSTRLNAIQTSLASCALMLQAHMIAFATTQLDRCTLTLFWVARPALPHTGALAQAAPRHADGFGERLAAGAQGGRHLRQGAARQQQEPQLHTGARRQGARKMLLSHALQQSDTGLVHEIAVAGQQGRSCRDAT